MKFLYKFFRFWIFVLFFISMCPWFTLSITKLLFSVIFVFLSIPILISPVYSRPDIKYTVFIIPVLILGIWTGRNNTFLGVIDVIIHVYSFFVFWCLKDKYKIDIIQSITKLFAILLIPSIVCHVLFLLGVNIPNQTIFLDSEAYPILYNYYFCIEVPYNIRFFGYFLEPGHMTMGLAPLLFVNKYNIKNFYVAILLLAQILSFSLAGYILAFVGFFYLQLTSSFTFKKILSLLAFGFAVGLVIYTISEILEEDVFGSLILERIQIEDGKLVGDDRTNYEFDQIYERFLNSSDVFWGQSDWGESRFEKGLSGFKKFFISNGVLGLILWLMSYFPMLVDKRYKNIGLFVIIALLLYQNAYPFWWCVIIITCIGNSYYRKKEIY